MCARVDGFDLHGRVAFGAHQRQRLEQLVQYCARPPLANDRLSKLPDGHYLLKLKGSWRDGTTHLKFEPIELMATILNGRVARKILEHLGLPARAPPEAPPRDPPPFWPHAELHCA